MNRLRKRSITSTAAAVLVAGVAIGALSGCGGPPPAAEQIGNAKQSARIPKGAVVTGGSVSQGQTSGWGTDSGITYGK